MASHHRTRVVQQMTGGRNLVHVGASWCCSLANQLIVCSEIVASMIWVNYNDLNATSLEIMVNKGNNPQMALIQVSEIL